MLKGNEPNLIKKPKTIKITGNFKEVIKLILSELYKQKVLNPIKLVPFVTA